MGEGAEVLELSKAQCDVRHARGVANRIDRHRPDWIINCAGMSDKAIRARAVDVIDVNLLGAIHVSLAAAAFGKPCILVASTAGMQAPAEHPWYGPAKAGVIAHVAAAGKTGQRIWALSPNRMDTPMRDHDWPDEDFRTRLSPFSDVVPVIDAIIDGQYPVGANVVVRKVGISGRVDVFQAPTVSYEGML
jgi:NAD(P)-dependent dehydrogenase (short-subunit alcohol dehydrogenase family)